MPLLTVPFQLALGTNRMYVLASAASNRALEVLGLPNAVQAPPPLVEYCHVPFVLTTAVTAMPDNAPGSLSVTLPAISAETSVPGLLEGSSLVAVKLLAPDRTGAALITVAVNAAENSEVLPDDVSIVVAEITFCVEL